MSYQIVKDSAKLVPVKGDERKVRVIVVLPNDPNEPDAFVEEAAWGRWHRTKISQLRSDVLAPIAKQFGLTLEAKHEVTKSKKEDQNGKVFDVGTGWVDWLQKLGGGRYNGGFILPTDGANDVNVTVTGGVSVARSAVILPDKARKLWVAYQTTPELGAEGKWSEPKTEVCAAKRFSEVKFLLIGEYHYPSTELYYPETAEKPAPATLELKAVVNKVKPKLVVKK